MIRRTAMEEEPKKKRMYIDILNTVIEIVNKIVVNENDRKRLIEQLKELDDKAERSIKKGLEVLGTNYMDR